jgi:glycosyltransferase involved in cell wall biosynthesis
VLPSLDVGGAEQVTVNIVNGLAARGYDVDLVVSRYEGRLRAELDADVTVVPLSDGRTPVVGVAAEFGPIVAYLEQAQPAALIPHLPRMSVVCLAAARVAGTDAAVFPTHHSAYGHGHDAAVKSRAVDWLVRRLYPTAERVIAVSEGVADGLARQTAVDRSDVSVLHNPIDVETVRERARDPVEAPWVEDDDAAVVLFVGRLADQKDLETWLGAFARIRERRPAVRGVVAGQGPQRASVRTLVDDLGLGDAVAVPGYVDNPYRYMAKADLFMLSSRYEGLPTVLIEAMACGCPVVATDCPSGPREILADGRHGGLAPVGDAAGLAEAAVATLDDPPAARRLRVRAEEFAPAAVLDEYEAFLRKYVTTA